MPIPPPSGDRGDRNRSPNPAQDPHGGFGETHVSGAARRQPVLRVPPELMALDAGTLTRDEYLALDFIDPDEPNTPFPTDLGDNPI